MAAEQPVRFGSYRLDPANERLWRDRQVVHLANKALAVLRYLVDHPGQLVTKESLFQAVWPETAVSDAVLTRCIQELRVELA